MVNFTCNHCGESLQKPRVEKHYQSSACSRKGISVSCMDCFKDFKLEEYVAHIKCISEEERYSAKGSVHAVKKGEVKQSTWVATVNSIIEQQINAGPGVRGLLEMISKHDNIPRKQKKFINFVTSMSGGRVNTRDITDVWGLLEAQKKTAQEAASTEQDKIKSKKRKPDDTSAEDATEDSSSKKQKTGDSQELSESKRKSKETTLKKKKKKRSESDKATVENGVNGKAAVTEPVQSVLDSTKASKLSDFCWKNAIMEVVNNKTEGLTQDQLKAEVFKMYESAKGEIGNQGQIAKTYNKKIKKLGNIKFENNFVTLIL